MELLPLGGNLASPQKPPQTETPATPAPAAVPQTPPYAAPPATPLHDANPWRAAAPVAQAAPPYEASRKDGPSSSAPTFGAIALVVLSLGAGILRAYNRQQMREERRMEQTRQQQDYEDGAQAAGQQRAAVERSLRAANAERNSYGQSARPNFPPPGASRVNYPGTGNVAGQDNFAPPSVEMRNALRREYGRYANGHAASRTVISTTGNGTYRAAVTYDTGDVQQFRFDGTTWTLEGGSAPPPSSGGAQAGQPSSMGQPAPMGQPVQSGQAYNGNGGNGMGQPMNGAVPGSGGPPSYNGTGGGTVNPVSGGAPAPGMSAPGSAGGPGSVPQNTGQNPTSGGTNPNGANPPASNPEPGAPPAGG